MNDYLVILNAKGKIHNLILRNLPSPLHVRYKLSPRFIIKKIKKLWSPDERKILMKKLDILQFERGLLREKMAVLENSVGKTLNKLI